MNKKRKILTLVALAVFGAIILSHYSTMGWHWVPSGKLREQTTWHYLAPGYDLTETEDGQPLYIYNEEGKRYLSNDPNAGPYDDLIPKNRRTRTSLKAPKGTIFKDGRIQYPTKTWLPDGTGTSHWRAEWVVSPSISMLPDVRMPLFVLAVFYAGLFALLGDNKRKEQ